MATNFREEANTLYKQRQFSSGMFLLFATSIPLYLTITTALHLYLKAATADQEDYRPLLNLSAVYFELGSYKQSVEYGQITLATMSDEVRQGPSGERALNRIAKARVLLKETEEFSNTVDLQNPRHLSRYKPSM
jgi:hypothetical protein